MSATSEIFNIIIHSNLFNFTIFLLIIIGVALKFDLSAVLARMKEKVVTEIQSAQKSKDDAIAGLESAKSEYSKIPEELNIITENAEIKMKTLTGQIVSDTERKIKNIEKNSNSILEAEQKQIESGVISRIGMKSVQVAQDNIILALQNNPQLHNKFIEDSITMLDEVVL